VGTASTNATNTEENVSETCIEIVSASASSELVV
jgi:hypothetical protein